MKRLFMPFAFAAVIQNAKAQSSVPQCTVLSVSHFGGDMSDAISPVPQLNNGINDSTFKVAISTSLNGSITTCSTEAFFQTYNAYTLDVVNEACAPIGTNFLYRTYYVFPQANGDTLLFGQSTDSSRNYGIERRDSLGNVLWTKSYGGSGDDGFVSAVPAPDGSGFFIGGGSNSNDGDVGLHYGSVFSFDIWIIKVNNDGDLLWSKVIGGTDDDGIGDMAASDDGGLYLFGATRSNDHDATGNHGSDDVYIVKLDSAGNILWHHCYGGSNQDGGQHYKALKDGSGGFFVAASTASSNGDVQHRPAMGVDFWLLHIDSAGNLLWENTYGGSGIEYIFDMCRATDGTFWIGGITDGGPADGELAYTYGRKDGWVAHVDTLGNLINSCTLGNDADNYLTLLQPLPNGNVLAGGSYIAAYSDSDIVSQGFPKQTIEGGIDFDLDIFLAKLSPENDLSIHPQQPEISLWNLFPNPAQQEVTIEIKNDDRKFHVAVTDAQGRPVYRDKFKSKITIPTASWPSGIYWVTLSRDKQSDTKKLIIQK